MLSKIMEIMQSPLWVSVLYLAPLTLCFYGYTIRTWINRNKDVKQRRDEENKVIGEYGHVVSYSPTDTIGTLVGRMIATVTPIVNIWAALFDVAPEVFNRFFKRIGKILDQPIVPKRSENEII